MVLEKYICESYQFPVPCRYVGKAMDKIMYKDIVLVLMCCVTMRRDDSEPIHKRFLTNGWKRK